MTTTRSRSSTTTWLRRPRIRSRGSAPRESLKAVASRPLSPDSPSASPVLDEDGLEHVASGLERVDRLLELLVDVLPADDRDRVLAGAEQLGDCLSHEPIALVLELAQRAELAVRVREPVEAPHAGLELRRRTVDHVALLARPLGHAADVVQLEVRGGVV